MKKLMILASVVAMSCVASAASYTWGFASVEIAGPTDEYNVDGFLDGGYAVLYLGGVEIARATQDPDEFSFGSFDFSASDDTGKVQTLGGGDISSTFVGQAYKLVLRTDDDKYEIVYNGVSSYQTVAGAVGEDVSNYETFITPTAFTAGDWQSVPEPTSGLLLLLGVAGLALRRRRA